MFCYPQTNGNYMYILGFQFEKYSTTPERTEKYSITPESTVVSDLYSQCYQSTALLCHSIAGSQH